MAIEATPSLSELTPEQQQTAVILARQRAMREVKRRRQKGGLRQTLSHAVLAAMANQHLDANPHLYAAAAADPLVQELAKGRR
jgi:hypothetical protein